MAVVVWPFFVFFYLLLYRLKSLREDFCFGWGEGCLLLPWWISESELDNWVYWRKLRANTSRIGLMNLCLLILSWSLCNWLRLGTRVLDWLNWAQLLILDVGILLLVNGPQVDLDQKLVFLCWSQIWPGLVGQPCRSHSSFIVEMTVPWEALSQQRTWNSWSTHSSGGGRTWLGAQGFLLRSEALLPRPSLGF